MIFRSPIRNEFLLLFSLHISIVLSFWYKPPFIFSGIVSDKCRDSDEYSNHYHMKNKQRHSFHGNTLFSTRFNFIQVDLWGIAIDATKSIFQYLPEIYFLTFIDSANVSTPSNATWKQYFTMPANKIASFYRTLIFSQYLISLFLPRIILLLGIISER